MKLPSKNSMLFNGAAGAFMLVGAVALLKSVILSDDVERCTARYNITTSFSLGDDSGTPLEPGAVQARLGSAEWGVLRNLKIEKVTDGPSDLVMRVGLSRAGGAAAEDDDSAGGLGFRWAPGLLNAKSAACLSYNIWLPKGFDFRAGGLLPGLFGDSDVQGEGAKAQSFAARFRWDEYGRGGVRVESGKLQRYDSDERRDVANFKLPAGRWVNLEQEVSLNSPGRDDGLLRLWVDGSLVYEDTAVNYRKHKGTGLRGVYADTRYLISLSAKANKKPQALRMSAFKLLWN